QPRDVEGRNIYLCSPDYMASYARRFIMHNVRVVGGCCGTTPEHIRQIKTAVRAMAPAVVKSDADVDRSAKAVALHQASGRGGAADPRGAGAKAPAEREAISSPPVAREKKSRFANALSRGNFVVAVELLPDREGVR